VATTVLELVGGRYANSVRAWIWGENVSITDWVKTNDLILAAAYENNSSKTVDSSTVVLRWRDVTDSGSFTQMLTTGEINSSGNTSLVNDNALISSEATFYDDITTWVNGLEREGVNAVAITLGPAGTGTECHWAIRTQSAQDGHEYEFELYDNSNGVTIGTLVNTITMAAGLEPEVITPAAISAVAATVAPTVVKGSASITPALAAAIAATGGITIIIEGMPITIFTERSLGTTEFTERSIVTITFVGRSIDTSSFTERTLGTTAFTERSLGTTTFTERDTWIDQR